MKNSSSCFYVFHKRSLDKISRHGRAVTAKNCTTKCAAEESCFAYSNLWVLYVLIAVAFAVAKSSLSFKIIKQGFFHLLE